MSRAKFQNLVIPKCTRAWNTWCISNSEIKAWNRESRRKAFSKPHREENFCKQTSQEIDQKFRRLCPISTRLWKIENAYDQGNRSFANLSILISTFSSPPLLLSSIWADKRMGMLSSVRIDAFPRGNTHRVWIGARQMLINAFHFREMNPTENRLPRPTIH